MAYARENGPQSPRATCRVHFLLHRTAVLGPANVFTTAIVCFDSGPCIGSNTVTVFCAPYTVTQWLRTGENRTCTAHAGMISDVTLEICANNMQENATVANSAMIYWSSITCYLNEWSLHCLGEVSGDWLEAIPIPVSPQQCQHVVNITASKPSAFSTDETSWWLHKNDQQISEIVNWKSIRAIFILTATALH